MLLRYEKPRSAFSRTLKVSVAESKTSMLTRVSAISWP